MPQHGPKGDPHNLRRKRRSLTLMEAMMKPGMEMREAQVHMAALDVLKARRSGDATEQEKRLDKAIRARQRLRRALLFGKVR